MKWPRALTYDGGEVLWGSGGPPPTRHERLLTYSNLALVHSAAVANSQKRFSLVCGRSLQK